MQRAAGYPRYSDNAQSPTSIEDQIREIRKLAARDGLTIPDEMIFPDYAVPGTSTVGRTGYRRLLDAWDAGLIDIIYVDEMSRLARNLATGGELIEKVERTGVIVVSGDGVDTRRESWQMLWTYKLVQSSQEVRAIAPRVIRGMKGQLERGHMIACPPMGYCLQRTESKDARATGTSWVVDEPAAAIVREMFQMRFSGCSHAHIARALNERGIAPPRRNRKGEVGFWRPGAIYQLLRNKIYRGIFEWNGSAYSRAKAAKARRVLEVIEYPRPALRLVDDDLWYACNPTDKAKRLRGGGTHLFSGLVRCGDCDARLTVGGGPKHFALNCSECDQNRRVGGTKTSMGYTSVPAAHHALYHALEQLFTGSVMEEFQARLRARLTAGPILEETQLREKLQHLNMARERATRMLSNPDIDENLFVEEVTRMSEEHKRTTSRLEQLTKLQVTVTPEVIERQCSVAPLPLLAAMLNGDSGLENYKIRATLQRLLHRFAFVQRPAKGVSVFEISFIPGALAAELTDTECVETEQVTFVVTSSTTARRPVEWKVEVRRK